MGEREWAFLLDENISPNVGRFLRKEGFEIARVPMVLSEGADDSDILPYAVENDFVTITQDVSDFNRLASAEHAGILLIYDQQLSPFEIVNGVLDIVDAYGDREQFTIEALDPWL
jgi:predicted nuclease of predicted toxin-antitoxin system